MSDKLVLYGDNSAISHHKMSIEANSVDAGSCKTAHTQIQLVEGTNAKLFLAMEFVEMAYNNILITLDSFCDNLAKHE